MSSPPASTSARTPSRPRLILPPLLKPIDLSHCKNIDEEGTVINLNHSPLKPERGFILNETKKNDQGKSVVVASYCFDIDEIYQWFIVQGNTSHPYTRRTITPTERNALLARHKELYPPAPQCPLTIYHSHHTGKPVVAVINPRVPNKWILFISKGGRGRNRYKLPPILLTPHSGAMEMHPYSILQYDKEHADKHLTGEAMDEIITLLRETFNAMQRPELKPLNRRPIQVYKDILQWDDEGNPIAPAAATGGRRKNLTVKDLQSRCRARGIPYSGLRKAELVAALQSRR